MFEKIIITTLKSFSAVIYVFIMLALFSVPVLFVYQAFQPPEFILEGITIPESLGDDEFLSGKEGNWHRIDFTMTASSGKFSPYSYKIEEFTTENSGVLSQFEDYEIRIDSPLEFSNTESDSFVLSLYVLSEEAPDFTEITADITFSAINYEKSFSEFSVRYNVTE